MGEDDETPQPVKRGGHELWYLLLAVVMIVAGVGGYIAWDKHTRSTSTPSTTTVTATARPTTPHRTTPDPDGPTLMQGMACMTINQASADGKFVCTETGWQPGKPTPTTRQTTTTPTGPTVTYRAWSNVAQTGVLSYNVAGGEQKTLSGFVFQRKTDTGTQYTWGYRFASTPGQELEVSIIGAHTPGAWVSCQIEVNGQVIARDRDQADDWSAGLADCSA